MKIRQLKDADAFLQKGYLPLGNMAGSLHIYQ
jgi:hypothetical protein